MYFHTNFYKSINSTFQTYQLLIEVGYKTSVGDEYPKTSKNVRI